MKLFKRTTLSLVTVGLALSSPFVLGQSQNKTTPSEHYSTATAARAASATDAKPIEDLQAAAQRLRDAAHVLAQAPAGPKRNQAIKDTNRTLMEVNDAMANLPPDLLTAQSDESKYKQSVDRLEQAAQRLRDSTHALAADPASKRRNETIKDINRALMDTQQVMMDVPLSAWSHESQTAASTYNR